jgi:hypothetical protein
MSFPKMLRIRQNFSSPTLADVPESVRREMESLELGSRIKPGQTVAITAGSRGIRDIAVIVRTMVEELKSFGAKPFIVPAMGSHGGATAQGQKRLLEALGLSAVNTGAPIRSSMEIVQVDSTPEGVPVYIDKIARGADHLVVLNRIKLHTDFSGPIQSGLLKMLLIGLGKYRGAALYHRAFVRFSFDHIVRSVAGRVLDRCNVLFGLAVVENHRHRTALVEVVKPKDFLDREPELLELSKGWTARLPFQRIDLLVIDRMGKEISGSGMDTNVLGRKGWPTPVAEYGTPQVTRVYVRDLTDASHGNAIGIGLADFARSRLIDKIDFKAMYVNAVASGTPFGATVPIHFETDREALENALRTIGFVDTEQARIVRIRDTLDLDEMLVSESYQPEILKRKDLKVVEEARKMEFDGKGNLSLEL